METNFSKEELKILLSWYSTHEHEGYSTSEDAMLATKIDKIIMTD